MIEEIALFLLMVAFLSAIALLPVLIIGCFEG
jgi:hypothetical protein